MVSHRGRIRLGIRSSIAGFVLLLFATTAGAEEVDTLHAGLVRLAAKIVRILNNHQIREASIKYVKGPTNQPGGAEPRIVLELSEELRRNHIEVRDGARAAIKADYDIQQDGAPGADGAVPLVVKFHGSIEDGPSVLAGSNFVEILRGSRAVREIVRPNIHEDPRVPEPTRNENTINALTEPRYAVQGNTVYSAPNSPYGIEILVGGESRKPGEDQQYPGFPFVRMGKEDTYVVRLHNDSDREAAVILTIDGINHFTFCDPECRDGQGKPRFDRVFVEPRSKVRIPGWFKNVRETEDFLVTDWGETAQKKLNNTGNAVSRSELGVITAQFMASWPRDKAPPADEVIRGDPDIGTGFGQRRDFTYRELEPRACGQERSMVSIRYRR
jgi:hypothetical protein